MTGPQGFAERSIQDLDLYPNPSAEWIELRSTQPLNGATATIFDLTGQILDERAHRTEDGHFRIDVRDLEPGAYHIRLSDSRSDRTVRFIKL
ncbi:MAG: T9SS type A sorting domain-containing protein [Flavobacteriales bacterium]|nr:T9SS type A sorting domain-containing protein [Flavobacteriales bacterium]